MATRKIKDAKDLTTNELIYFKGHAKATYMSNGMTVEDAINNIEIGGGGTSDLPPISTSAEGDTLVQRFEDGGIETTYLVDDAGLCWATETSSQDIRDSADYFFAIKKRAEPIFGNDVNIEILSPDKIYFWRDMSGLTSITIGGFEVRDDVNEYFIHFRTGEGGTTLSMPSSVYWANGEIPEIEPSTEYELSITLYNDGGQYVTKAVLTKFAQV